MNTGMFVSETKSWSPLLDGIVTGKCGYNFNRLYEKKVRLCVTKLGYEKAKSRQ